MKKSLFQQNQMIKGDFSYSIHDEQNAVTIVFSKEGYEVLRQSLDQVVVKKGKMKVQLVPKKIMIRGRVSVGSNVKFK